MAFDQHRQYFLIIYGYMNIMIIQISLIIFFPYKVLNNLQNLLLFINNYSLSVYISVLNH